MRLARSGAAGKIRYVRSEHGFVQRDPSAWRLKRAMAGGGSLMDMGIYSLLVWVVANAIVVANAGITMAAIKFIAELRGAGRDDATAVLVRRLRRMQRNMLLIVVVALCVVFAIAHGRIAPGVDLWLLGLLILSVAFRAPYMFNIAVLKGGQDFRSTAVVAIIGASFNLALVILAWMKAASLQTIS